MRSSRVVTILLVEDDEVDVKALKWAFDKLKVANPLVIARDGTEALEMLKELPRPYLIITDINMPLTPLRVWQSIQAAQGKGEGPARTEQGKEGGMS